MAYGTTKPILVTFDDLGHIIVITFDHTLKDSPSNVAGDQFTSIFRHEGVYYNVAFTDEGVFGLANGSTLTLPVVQIGDVTTGPQRVQYVENGLFLDSDGNSIHSFTIYDAIAKRSAHYAALRKD